MQTIQFSFPYRRNQPPSFDPTLRPRIRRHGVSLLLAACMAWNLTAEDDLAKAVNAALRNRPAASLSPAAASPEVPTGGQAAAVAAALARTVTNLSRTNRSASAKALAAEPASQASAIRTLKQQAGQGTQVLLRPGNRTVMQIKGRVLEPAVSGPALALAGERHESTARKFLRTHRTLLRLDDPDQELVLKAQDADAAGRRLSFRQTWQGIPVWPAGLGVHMDSAGNVNLVDGAYAPTPSVVEVQPKLDAWAAGERAKACVAEGQGRGAVVTEPVLIIYTPIEGEPRLGWRLDLTVGLTQAWRIVIDARNGRVLHRSTRIHDAGTPGSGVDFTGTARSLNVWQQGATYYLSDTSKPMFNAAFDPVQDPQGVITVSDANGTPIEELGETTVFQVTSTSPDSWSVPAAISAAFNFSQTYDYFLDRHGRSSLDGEGGNVTAIVRVGDYDNASWHGNLRVMLFGDVRPFAASLDVVGHELTHGVTETSAGLIYENQSGALNEAFSDILGEMVEARTRGQNDWLVGSELAQPLRNMKDPASIAIPGLGRSYPSKMSEFVELPNTPQTDNGGVHLNSSIINHAFYQLAEGLPGAIGRLDAERIFFRCLTQHLQAQSQFIDCRLGCIAAAEALFGADSNPPRRTAEAFDRVEIFGAPTTPKPTPVPVVQGPDSAFFVYFDPDLNSYELGRRETAQGDSQFGSAFANDIHPARAAVSGDGSLVLFVDSEFDICAAETEDRNTRECLGFAGFVHSVALSPDGRLAAFVLRDPLTEQPEGQITVVDIEAGTAKTYNLVAPSLDGVSVDAVLHADAMTFSTDGSALVYDAVSRLQFGNGPTIERWSVYGLNLATETTSIIVPPIEGLNTGNPSFGRAGNRYLAFDAISPQSGNSGVLVLDLFTGEAGVVGLVENGTGLPSFTGDEGAVVYAARDPLAFTTGFSLFKQNLTPDRLGKDGEPTVWCEDAMLGMIYRRGAFSGTNALPAVTLMANPAQSTAPATITLNATAADADGTVSRIEFYSGPTKLGEVTGIPYEFAWRNVPAGTYRLVARATDNVGGTADSTAVQIVVQDPAGGGDVHLRGLWLPAGAIRLTVEGPPGDYIIQQSSDLKNWTDIYPVTVGPEGSGSVDDSGGPQNMPVLIYRTRKVE